VAAIAAKVAPALVDINGTFPYQGAQGAGTGIVLTSSGVVLTNNHVIDGATAITVTDIGNGKTYKATVAGYDAGHDIAVLHLEGASGLKTATLADSSKVTVGEPVVAIGNAGGTGGTPSSAAGTVTALNQSITASNELDGTSENLTGLIQTDAAIQSGDSGGALVNQAGAVVAMNTAASSGSSFSSYSSSGTQGFAIPLNQAATTARTIQSGSGSSTVHVGPTAFLGLLLTSDSSSDTQGSFGSTGGVGGNGSATGGASVARVVSNGPAATAGVGQGDVISSLDGHAIVSDTTLGTLLVTHHPGDKVQLSWTDPSGQSHTSTVTLAEGPPA
jgi:S1-C subfamily serine protease